MQVAELEASGTPDVMQPEDSVDTIIRQAAGREPLLCVPRASENTEHWLQLLHVFDQQGDSNFNSCLNIFFLRFMFKSTWLTSICIGWILIELKHLITM